MSPTVVPRTRDELLQRRATLLDALHAATSEEVAERVAAGVVSDEQWPLVEALHDVQFLLGSE